MASMVDAACPNLHSGRLLTRLFYHVRATDPSTLAAIAAMTLLVPLVACIVPDVRALRLDPVTAPRAD